MNNQGKRRDSIQVVGMRQRIVEKDESQDMRLAGEASSGGERVRGKEG
jgi:hypothetical protein